MIFDHPLLEGFPKLEGLGLAGSVSLVIDFLRRKFPDLLINGLMSDLWDLFSEKHILAIENENVPSMSATVVMHRSGKLSFPIWVPSRWAVDAMVDPVMACGSLIFCGSQAVDFFNGKLIDQDKRLFPDAVPRSIAFESTFLLHFSRQPHGWEPNRYQKGVIEKFPDGIPSNMLYDRKPVVTLN